MRQLASRWVVVASTVVATAGAAAAAIPFPPDDDYIPLVCDGAPMNDRFADESGAVAERDIVGDFGDAAGYRASDDTNLYLRLRLDQDPAPGGSPRPFAWGFEIDLDGVLSTYELLILVDGVAGQVKLLTNRVTTSPNDPTDPADEPALFTAPFSENARSTIAGDSAFGGDDDYFLDFGLPWNVLMPNGLDRDTAIFVWAASSSSANSLDGDFACHDGATGEPVLDLIASDETAGDPTIDTDGDGFTDAEENEAGTDPLDPADFPSSRLEGGGGCATTGDHGALLALGLGALLARRRRARVDDIPA